MHAPPPPTLILLPGGLCVSGVAVWAARLASGLAERGGLVSLALFAHPDARLGAGRLDVPLDPRVRKLDMTALDPIDRCNGELSAYLPMLRDEALRLGQYGPVAVLPNQHGDCFGLAAALTQIMGDRIRVVGTAHSDNAYDLRLLTHYAGAISRFVAVSDTLNTKARAALPGRDDDVAQIPYGVPEVGALPARDPLRGRAVRLLYAGRFEHRQKRVLALPILSDLLSRAGVRHELTIAGEGPARPELTEACEGLECVRVLGAQSQAQLARLYASHDALVLASRYEGLSVSMLEAMSLGCVPIVTRCASGSAQAIEDGRTGLIAEVSPEADERAAAAGLAACIARFVGLDGEGMAEAAAEEAARRFSLSAHVEAWSGLLRAAATGPERWWPATRPAAFTSEGGQASGSVPTGAAEALRRLLRDLAGRALLVHGAGRHTIELAPLLAGADVRALVDDDPARFGERLLGWKVIGPHEAAWTGATDVIISSSIHEQAIWARRHIYEEQGLRVHRLNHAAQVEAKPSSLAAAIRP